MLPMRPNSRCPRSKSIVFTALVAAGPILSLSASHVLSQAPSQTPSSSTQADAARREPGAELPLLLPGTRPNERRYWLSEKALNGEVPGLDLSGHLKPVGLQRLERTRDRADPTRVRQRGCVEYHVDRDSFVTFGSLSELVAGSDTILRGTVTERAGGLVADHLPSLLFNVSIRQTLKERDPALQRVHVFYPAGELRIRGTNYCLTSTGYPDPPDPGAEVIVFLLDDGLGPSSSIFSPLNGGIMFSDATGGVAATARWRRELEEESRHSLADLDALWRHIEGIVLELAQ